jgi:hypothetical protein
MFISCLLLTKSKLYPESTPRIIPFQSAVLARNATSATFQTALELDIDITAFLVDRVEMGGADVQAVLFLAISSANFLVDADVAFLVQLESVQSQFGLYVHRDSHWPIPPPPTSW